MGEADFPAILRRLRSYPIPPDWPANLFLLPEDVMSDLHRHVLRANARRCIELGTGFGATACVLADALRQIRGERLITIDLYSPSPVGLETVSQFAGVSEWIDAVVDPLGYNWVLADMLAEDHHRTFDLCLLDGAHEWVPDGLAFTLAAELIAPGGWIVIDDINFRLRDMTHWRESHGHLTDRELDTYQMRMVLDILLRRRRDFGEPRVTHGGRLAWAKKRRVFTIAV